MDVEGGDQFAEVQAETAHPLPVGGSIRPAMHPVIESDDAVPGLHQGVALENPARTLICEAGSKHDGTSFALVVVPDGHAIRGH